MSVLDLGFVEEQIQSKGNQRAAGPDSRRDILTILIGTEEKCILKEDEGNKGSCNIWPFGG